MSSHPIYVTRPYLSPLEEFIPYLEKIWENKVVTNNGPFHQELESELCKYLGVEYISLFTNGTIALVTALQALKISGEVITTPYSFVATSHSLVWNNITPVFVDIDSKTCNLDSEQIEAAITSKTQAIMPVHCYGNPCEVEQIEKIANKYKLKVIYDAAHAFGVRYKGKSVLKYGDLSVLSFHATKVFNTIEGGAIVSPDRETKKQIDFLKNFGFADEVTVVAPGINGKMSELNAAFGLLQLKHIDKAMERRKQIQIIYRSGLTNIRGVSIPETQKLSEDNASYFPIFIGADFPLTRDDLYWHLKNQGINGRRYFFPLLSNMSMYKHLPSSDPRKLLNAHTAANNVICLPIYPDMNNQDVDRVIQAIKKLGRPLTR
jgi:dTDP-4-amino-4,6-dideoxygalactose transaminase